MQQKFWIVVIERKTTFGHFASFHCKVSDYNFSTTASVESVLISYQYSYKGIDMDLDRFQVRD